MDREGGRQHVVKKKVDVPPVSFFISIIMNDKKQSMNPREILNLPHQCMDGC